MNEINSVDNSLIGNSMFSKDYTFYDEDMEMANTIVWTQESTKEFNQINKSNLVYMELLKFSNFKISHSRIVYNFTDLLSDLGGL